MISIAGTVIIGSAGSSLPTAAGAGELPVSSGAGTTYTATSSASVVSGVIESLVGATAGAAPIGDGVGGVAVTSTDVSAMLASANAAAVRTAIGGESALPRLSVASALHHWRCDESASPFADLGSSPVDLAYVSGTREYGRAGVYTRYGCTMQRSPGATNRVEAVVADIPAATDLTFGVTVSSETRADPNSLAVIAAISDGAGAGVDYGLYLLTATLSRVYLAVHHGASASADSSQITLDWSRPHRLEVTYATATRVATLYVDGIASATATPASGTMAALTRCAAGGLATAFAGVGGSSLMAADLTVHLSALSAADVLSRADVCRRLAGG